MFAILSGELDFVNHPLAGTLSKASIAWTMSLRSFLGGALFPGTTFATTFVVQIIRNVSQQSGLPIEVMYYFAKPIISLRFTYITYIQEITQNFKSGKINPKIDRCLLYVFVYYICIYVDASHVVYIIHIHRLYEMKP